MATWVGDLCRDIAAGCSLKTVRIVRMGESREEKRRMDGDEAAKEEVGLYRSFRF